MKRSLQTNGYSLVEVLVAIAILMISIVGPITIAAKSLQSAQYARQQNTAFFLAQEGISIVNALRNNGGLAALEDDSVDPWAWSTHTNLAPCFAASGCNIDFRDATLVNNVVSCATPASCTLRYDKEAPRAVYQLVQGDTTPFTRVLRFSSVTDDEIIVESRVNWGSSLLGGEQSVFLSTSLFNLFK